MNSGFWIGDFGLLIPEFARLPAIESVELFPRIDITLVFFYVFGRTFTASKIPQYQPELTLPESLENSCSE